MNFVDIHISFLSYRRGFYNRTQQKKTFLGIEMSRSRDEPSHRAEAAPAAYAACVREATLMATRP